MLGPPLLRFANDNVFLGDVFGQGLHRLGSSRPFSFDNDVQRFSSSLAEVVVVVVAISVLRAYGRFSQ